MIPKHVTHKQYLEAIEPLLTLLGTTSENVYMSGPGIVISPGEPMSGVHCRISFLHAVPAEGEEFAPPARLASRRAPGGLQVGDEGMELMQPITVEVGWVEPSSKLLRGASDEAIANRAAIRATASALQDRQQVLDTAEADGFSRHEVQDYLDELQRERRPEGQQ